MSLDCPVLRRRCFAALRNPVRHAAILSGLCALFLASLSGRGQTRDPFPLAGLLVYNIPQESPPLTLSGLGDTVALTWPAVDSNFVVQSSSDLGSGIWTHETNAVLDVVGGQTIATVPLRNDHRFFRLLAPKVCSVPVFQFAIFYNSLLEFTWGATLTVNGRVHANGSIFVGSSSPLTFNSVVSTAGAIYKTNWDGHTLGQMTGAVTYNGSPGWMTNVTPIYLHVGTDSFSPAAAREIINPPPPGEDPNSVIGEQRYYNRAGVVLLVSNQTVTAYLKSSPIDVPITLAVTNSGTNSFSLLTNFPFLSVTNSFIDQRESSKWVRPTQINVGIYRSWVVTNLYVAAKFPPGSGLYPNVLYVADFRTSGPNTNLYSVRLINGSIIPTNGWTVATPNPLYVYGHYNIGPGGSTTPGNTDTSKTFPASLVSDALTVLSPNWQDANSAGALASRTAANTTVNAAILTGLVYSTDSSSNHFSGGVMNVPRLLEDWGNGGTFTLTLNTSIVNLFDSARATNWFINAGVYYYAPTRAFSFDNNFTNATKLPPATPALTVTAFPY
jgi:hypothetical protein